MTQVKKPKRPVDPIARLKRDRQPGTEISYLDKLKGHQDALDWLIANDPDIPIYQPAQKAGPDGVIRRGPRTAAGSAASKARTDALNHRGTLPRDEDGEELYAGIENCSSGESDGGDRRTAHIRAANVNQAEADVAESLDRKAVLKQLEQDCIDAEQAEAKARTAIEAHRRKQAEVEARRARNRRVRETVRVGGRRKSDPVD